MGQLLEQAKANRRSNGATCSVVRVREQLAGAKDKTLLQDFEAALADRSISSPALSKALGGFGVNIKEGPIGHHRRGDCSCKRV